MKRIPKHDRLMMMIPHGEENAVSMRELARLCSASPREVRKMVEVARCDGMIIASSDQGYFIPESKEELLAYYRCVKCRIATAIKTLRPVEDLLEVLNDADE